MAVLWANPWRDSTLDHYLRTLWGCDTIYLSKVVGPQDLFYDQSIQKQDCEVGYDLHNDDCHPTLIDASVIYVFSQLCWSNVVAPVVRVNCNLQYVITLEAPDVPKDHKIYKFWDYDMNLST